MGPDATPADPAPANPQPETGGAGTEGQGAPGGGGTQTGGATGGDGPEGSDEGGAAAGDGDGGEEPEDEDEGEGDAEGDGGICQPTDTVGCVQCEITSETVMTQPPDRARRNIGVGERVRLTFSLGEANWEVTRGHGALSSSTGTMIVYRAPPTAQDVTVTATGGGCTAVIDLTIVAPTRVRLTLIQVLHERHTNKIGMNARIYFGPDTVNFHRVEYMEDDVNSTASGVYGCNNNTPHFPALAPHPATTRVVADLGTRIDADDEVTSGFCNFGRNMGDGQIRWNIPWKYRVQGASQYHRIQVVPQICTSAADGTLRARKAGATARANYGDPGTW
jgi:hypothetical protein